jgi:hypothetical protein
LILGNIAGINGFPEFYDGFLEKIWKDKNEISDFVYRKVPEIKNNEELIFCF